MSEEKEIHYEREMTEEEAAAFATACEEVIDAIKNGEMEGEYFEF